MSLRRKNLRSLAPYPIHQNDDGSYGFITKNQIEYKCIFSELENGVLQFPGDCNEIGFSIIPTEKETKEYDPKVGRTACEVLEKFLDIDANNVLSFICENGDERGRKSLNHFIAWFKKFENDKVMFTVSVTDIFSAGFIMNKDCPEIDNIRSQIQEEKVNFEREKEGLKFKYTEHT